MLTCHDPPVAQLPACPVQRPRKAYPAELAQFHSPEYIAFLSQVGAAAGGRELSQHLMSQQGRKGAAFGTSHLGQLVDGKHETRESAKAALVGVGTSDAPKQCSPPPPSATLYTGLA